jgi:hypothetical protein
MAMKKTHGRTASGKPITDELVEQLADQAEAGYASTSKSANSRRAGNPPPSVASRRALSHPWASGNLLASARPCCSSSTAGASV